MSTAGQAATINSGTKLPEAAYAAALASLPGTGPAWLAGLLAAGPPSEAWRRVLLAKAPGLRAARAGRQGPGPERLAEIAARLEVAGLWQRCTRSGIQAVWLGGPGYPAALAEGPSPPGVLFVAGDCQALGSTPAVGLIGTRRCTPPGAEVAWQLGYDLAAAGVLVVSGLALGIDGAAHSGALSAFKDVPGAATTLGVAASGVDVVYPRQHAALWAEVVRQGAVVSETPPGTPAQSWRFPSRNRVIAGLVQMVVVVESHAAGGSWHTVDAALRRGNEVGAVPGPVNSSASVGTNTLLHDGALPVRGAQDVLDALGLAGGGRSISPPSTPSRAANRNAGGRGQSYGAAHQKGGPGEGPLARLGPIEQKVFDALGWQSLCLEEIIELSGLPPAAVVVGLDNLDQQGLAFCSEGWWSKRPGGR